MKKLSLITLLIIFAAIIKTSPANAACDFGAMDPENDGTFAFDTTCGINAQIIDGVDWAAGSETATDNTAIFNISGGVFTLNGGTSENITTFVTGIINITGGNISMADPYSQIKINAPKYCGDADADGWATDFTYFDASISGLRRCSLMHSTALTDCNDADPNITGEDQITYYQDLDGDTYGNSSVSQSACSPPANYVTNNTDCYDADPGTTNAELAYPGSGTCSGTNRGDGSFDYNCSSSQTYCGTTNNLSCTPTGTIYQAKCAGAKPNKRCGGSFINIYVTGLSNGCGVWGCICSKSAPHKTQCDSDGDRCWFVDLDTYCITGLGSTQACQ